ncbi:hypothetical protein GX586_10750, partial [bacterium]|nr:hypothetical protein [bacterium]
MTGRRLAVAAWYVTFTTITTFAAVHYVVPQNGTNAISPYLSWSTAATNIQDAVDAALSGDTVLVSNGWYTLGVSSGGYAFATNVVSITKAVTVASVGGPGVTFICGREWRPGEPPWRCVYMEQGAVLAGFNVTNGWTDPSCTNWPDAVANGGGGIHANGGIISNCIVAQCSAYLGAGIYARGGSLIAGCTITGNVTQAYSGGNGGGLCL